jgi:hypothetical protein
MIKQRAVNWLLNCCWPSPDSEFFVPSLKGLMAINYCQTVLGSSRLSWEWRYSSTILKLSIKRLWVVTYMPLPLYPREKSPRYPLDRLGGPRNRSGRCWEESHWATVNRIETTKIHIGFEVFTTVTMENVVFWNVAPCKSCVNRRFGGKYRLHLQVRKIRERGISMNRWLADW